MADQVEEAQMAAHMVALAPAPNPGGKVDHDGA
jgi:hypothetical protein